MLERVLEFECLQLPVDPATSLRTALTFICSITQLYIVFVFTVWLLPVLTKQPFYKRRDMSKQAIQDKADVTQ